LQLTPSADPNDTLRINHCQYKSKVLGKIVHIPVALFSTSLVSNLQRKQERMIQKLTLRPSHLILNPRSTSVVVLKQDQKDALLDLLRDIDHVEASYLETEYRLRIRDLNNAPIL
jgi:hypothetical protein